MLTLVMAYSVALVLKKQGFDQVKIKWPNDLILSNKKVCGILTEMFLKENQVDYVVIGVGVNVNVREFSHELVDKATSLYMESGETMDIEPMLEDIVDVFHDQYNEFLEAGDLSFLQTEYNQMLINQDREVVIVEKEQEYRAQALGINEKGELLVQTADGNTQAIYAGEVSVRGVYGYV
jgi:BirA family biotin operon repressor/biotin-[acetyl-CoA-carboxylase] ligase